MQKDINYYFILFFLFCLAAGHQFKFPDQITSRFLRDTRISNQGKVYISYILVWFWQSENLRAYDGTCARAGFFVRASTNASAMLFGGRIVYTSLYLKLQVDVFISW